MPLVTGAAVGAVRAALIQHEITGAVQILFSVLSTQVAFRARAVVRENRSWSGFHACGGYPCSLCVRHPILTQDKTQQEN